MAVYHPENFCLKEEIVPLPEDCRIERIHTPGNELIIYNANSDTHAMEHCQRCGANTSR